MLDSNDSVDKSPSWIPQEDTRTVWMDLNIIFLKIAQLLVRLAYGIFFFL